MDLNKVTIIGHVVRDPEQRLSVRGITLVQFMVATLSVWRDPASKTRCESVDFHDVVAVGRLGKVATHSVAKGARVYVEGRLHNQVCKRKDGTTYIAREIALDQLIRFGELPGDGRTPEDVEPPVREEPEVVESAASSGEGAVR